MFKKLLMIAWVGLIGLTVSCKGPQGDVGPQGAKGDTGAAGAAGPAGQNGEGGSGAFVFTSGADTTDAEGSFYSGVSFNTAADAALFENSAILVYVKSQGVYWPVPGVVSFGTGKVTNFTFVHFIDGADLLIDILSTSWSETQTTPPVRIAQDIKVILVPAELLGRVNGELKSKTYEEALTILGLTDQKVITSNLNR